MPIHANHIRHIHQIIDHLLDFEQVSSEHWLEQIRQLQKNIENYPNSPEGNDTQLATCILWPQDTLLKLERCTAPATSTPPNNEQRRVAETIQSFAAAANIDQAELPALSLAEVLLYVAACVEKALKERIATLGIDLPEIVLYDSICKMAKQHLLTVFESEPFVLPEEAHPELDLGNQHDQIYSAQLKIQEVDHVLQSFRPILTVTTFLSEHPKQIVKELDEYSDFGFDSEQDREDFLFELRQKASRESRIIASDLALEELENKYQVVVDASIVDNEMRRLICHRRYWDALTSGKILLEDISLCDKETTKILLDPHVADLVTSGILSVEQASNLEVYQLKLLKEPYLHQLLRTQSLNIEKALALRENRCKFITHPVILHLVRTEKLSFDQACRLPFFLVFPKNNRQFGLFAAPEPAPQIGLLVASHTRDHFAKTQINWRTLEKMTLKQAQFLMNPIYFGLLTSNKLSLEDIVQLSNSAIDLIQSIPNCYFFFENDLLHISRFFNCNDQNDQAEMIAFIFSSRLYWIFKNECLIQNDTISQLINDFVMTHQNLPQLGYDIFSLRNLITHYFLSFLQQDVMSVLKSQSPENLDGQLIILNNQLALIASDNEKDSNEKLGEVCRLAQTMLATNRTNDQSRHFPDSGVEPSAKRRKIIALPELSSDTLTIYQGLIKISDFQQNFLTTATPEKILSL